MRYVIKFDLSPEIEVRAAGRDSEGNPGFSKPGGRMKGLLGAILSLRSKSSFGDDSLLPIAADPN